MPLQTPDSGTLTNLLAAMRSGDKAAQEDLFDRVYEELRQIARSLATNIPAHADLDPGTLVNAACERLLRRENLDAEDRRQFFFIFGRAMHDVVVEEARRAARQKRSPSDEYFRTQPSKVHFKPPKLTLSEFELRLQEFQAVDPDAAEVVRLLFLSGRSMRQTASDLGITLGSVRAHWAYARAWLSQRAKQDQE